MSSNDRHKRRSYALAVAALLASTVAAAAHGVPAGGGPAIVSERPDLTSATMTQAATATQGARVRYCFDEPVQAGNAGASPGQPFDAGDAPGFELRGYDAGDRVAGTSAVSASGRTNCVDVDFQPSGGVPVDVAGFTTGAAVTGAVQNVSGSQALGASAALEGSAEVPVRRSGRQGATAGPDLLEVAVTDASFGEATFTFDEPLYTGGTDLGDLEAINGEVSGGGAEQDADRFAYFGQEGCSAGCPRVFGASVVGVTNTATQGRVVVRFAEGEGTPAGDIQEARRFTVVGDTVSSLQGNENTSEAFSVGPTFSPEMVGARQVSNNTFEITYDESVSVNFARCYVLYTDDGQRAYAASGFTRPAGGDLRTAEVAFAGVQGFNDSVVKIAEDAGTFGCANDVDSPTRQSIPATIGVRATNQAPGFSDAPDLVGVETGPGNTARFRFDSPVDPARAQAPGNAAAFQLVQSGGFSAPFAGSGVEGVLEGDVTIRFGDQTAEQVAAALGGRVDSGAVCNAEQAAADGPSGLLKRQGVQRLLGGGGPANASPVGGPPEGDNSATDEGDNDCSFASALAKSSLVSTSTTTGTSTGGTGQTAGTSTAGTAASTGPAATTGPAASTGPFPATTTTGTSTTRIPGRLAPTAVRAAGNARQGRSVIRGSVSGRIAFTQGRPCAGRVKIGIRFGDRRRIARWARMRSSCTFTSRFALRARRLPPRLRPRHRRVVLRIAYRFQGNSQLRPALSPTARVRVVR